MNNKILVQILIPEIDEVYDLFIPININKDRDGYKTFK